MENHHKTTIDTPTEILTGGLFFYFLKIGLILFAVLSFAAGVLVLIVGTYATFTSGPLTLEMIALQGVVCIFTFNALSIGNIFVHMYPQLGISNDRLWYRHFFFGWNSIRWQDIEEIRAAKTVFVTQGTVVFSPQLPWYYRFFGRSYGRRKGRALFIPNQLVTHQEFLALLRQHNVRVRISI